MITLQFCQQYLSSSLTLDLGNYMKACHTVAVNSVLQSKYYLFTYKSRITGQTSCISRLTYQFHQKAKALCALFQIPSFTPIYKIINEEYMYYISKRHEGQPLFTNTRPDFRSEANDAVAVESRGCCHAGGALWLKKTNSR